MVRQSPYTVSLTLSWLRVDSMWHLQSLRRYGDSSITVNPGCLPQDNADTAVNGFNTAQWTRPVKYLGQFLQYSLQPISAGIHKFTAESKQKPTSKQFKNISNIRNKLK